MMRSIAGAAILAVLLSATAPQVAAETDLDRDGLRGPVQSVTILRTEATQRGEEMVEGEPVPVAEVTYDRHGYRTEVRTFALDGGIYSHRRITYSEPGRIAEEVVEHTEPDATGTWTYVHEGDTTTGTFETPEGDVTETRKMVENADGKVVDDRRFDRFGDERRRIEASYEDGRLATSRRYEIDKFEGEVERRYDPQGRLVEEMRRDSFERPYSRSAFEYNERGDLSRLQEYRWVGGDDADTLFTDIRYEYRYDEHGNWIHRSDEVTYRAQRGRMRESLETAIREIRYYE